MRRVAAPLAAVLCALAAAGCGGGAEPGAPQGATLMLDFTPNAVHTGIYVAQHRGYFEDEGIDLTIREPAASSDAPKLLQAGRVDFAILDINDLGIALDQGFELRPLAGIVSRPLAAVIAHDSVSRPRDLVGGQVGVTGLPSDDAVLDTVIRSDGGDPAAVERVNIGFNAVAALATGKVDAATAFWNAEGVALRRERVGIREFRVDRYGAPRFPELLLVTSESRYEALGRDEVTATLAAIRRGYRQARKRPTSAVADLIDQVPDLDPAQAGAELQVLRPVLPVAGLLEGPSLHRLTSAWGRWAVSKGLFERNPFPAVPATAADS